MEDNILDWYDEQCRMMHVLRLHFGFAVKLWSRNKNSDEFKEELREIVVRYQDLCHNLMEIVEEKGFNIKLFLNDSRYV